jgi:hypothetical protein
MAASSVAPLVGFFSILALILVFTIINTGFVVNISSRVQDEGFLTPDRTSLIPSCAPGQPRRVASYRLRELEAYSEAKEPVPCHGNNGDEALYSSTRIGSFTKGLPHDSLGQVLPAAYGTMLQALNSKLPSDFDSITLGGTVKLTNPQGGLAFALTGSDPQALYQPPAPTLASDWEAGELVENYWMALARDVNFDQYGLEPITYAAITEIAALNDWRGPAPSPSTLFRGSSPGCSTGPYLSQFFYMSDSMGPNTVDPQIAVYVPNVDFLTNWTEFLSVQNGNAPTSSQEYVPNFKRYMINGRDISRWVHMDVLFQAYLQAGMILMNMGAPLKASLPYFDDPTQIGFATFGPPHYLSAVVEVADYALRAVWFQKWYVHRRLRPEEAGGLVDRTKQGYASYPLTNDILSSNAVAATWTKFGSYLLPQAFPEGCPTHPSYGAGHATVAGACVTMLKFWFDEDFVLPAPVAPSADGSTLNSISATLTVGGELNKLANNVAFGRNIAGVHWRSDAQESLLLGEQLAISFLRDQKATYNEVFGPWTATGFDGTLLVVE